MTVQGPVKEQQPDGPHAHGNTARQGVDDRNAEGSGQQKPGNDPRSNQSLAPVTVQVTNLMPNVLTFIARAQGSLSRLYV